MSTRPFVSVVIPCRNEERYIGPCLDSILACEYPRDRLEIFVIDGASTDGTRAILDAYAATHDTIAVVDNPRRIVPAALNLGIARSRGDVIMRMDAHCSYPEHYISGLVDWLERSGADNVGSACLTKPGADTPRARAIARGLSHPLGVGNSWFRIGSDTARWVDTVPFGCFRREVFDRVGLFHEDLIRNQDDELNHRLIRQGGRILLVPGLQSAYFARATLSRLWRTYYQYGYYKPLVVRKIGAVVTVRQLIPPAFVMTLVTALLLSTLASTARAGLAVLVTTYVTAVGGAALLDSRSDGLRERLWLAVVLPTLHLSYGAGYLRGLFDMAIGRSPAADGDLVPTR